MSSSLKIRTFTGKGVKTYIPSLAKLRIEILQEYPFLHSLSMEEESEKFKHIIQYKETIVVIVFDNTKIVGASLAFPLQNTSINIQKPFLDKGLNPNNYFYFGESVLLKNYRGRGIGHHFFDLREKHAKSLKKFSRICFSSIKRPKDDPRKPKGYVDLETFWKKRGYIEYPDMTMTQSWQDIGSSTESKKTFVIWMSGAF